MASQWMNEREDIRGESSTFTTERKNRIELIHVCQSLKPELACVFKKHTQARPLPSATNMAQGNGDWLGRFEVPLRIVREGRA